MIGYLIDVNLNWKQNALTTRGYASPFLYLLADFKFFGCSGGKRSSPEAQTIMVLPLRFKSANPLKANAFLSCYFRFLIFVICIPIFRHSEFRHSVSRYSGIPTFRHSNLSKGYTHTLPCPTPLYSALLFPWSSGFAD